MGFRGLALLLPFLLLSFVAWPADGQDSRGTAGVLDCDPVTACFLDLVLKLAEKQNAANHPVVDNIPVTWNTGEGTADPPPNIIVILADDMGFNDISLYNGETTSTIPTPEIDALAHQGVVFTNGYAANATCAPSRAALMTGRYSTRFGFEFTPLFKVGYTIFDLIDKGCSTDPYPLILDRELADTLPELEELGMPPSEITVAETLKGVGYHTVHIGKWHLGGTSGSRPEDQGFDESLYLSGILYLPEDDPGVVNAKLDFSPIDTMVWASAWYSAQFNGGPEFEPNGYLTDYYTDEAVKAIQANKNRPFFLYLSHWGIHNPLQAKLDDYTAMYDFYPNDTEEHHRLRVYAAMIRALDRSVGDVMDALDDNGLTDNTLVIFTSDNGGAPYVGLPNINQPYRGWKTTFFEGGIHVPYFMSWPGTIEAGTTYDKPVTHFDIFATAAAAAGAALPSVTIDGVDLVPYVIGTATGEPHETLFWRSGHYQVVLSKDDGTGHWWKMSVADIPDKVWLYNLSTDPTEQTNVALSETGKVAELQLLLDAHNAEQVESIWPSVLQDYVTIDKTDEEILFPEDEYIYWPN